MSGKEMAMKNTVLTITYLISERYEAMSKAQGLDFIRSYKIMRKRQIV